MKPIFHIAAAVSFAALFSSGVLAQGIDQGGAGAQGGPPPGGEDGSMGLRIACRNDAQKFCSDVQPGGGLIINCLMQHYNEVSDNCFNMLDKLQNMGGPRGGQAVDDSAPPPPAQSDYMSSSPSGGHP